MEFFRVPDGHHNQMDLKCKVLRYAPDNKNDKKIENFNLTNLTENHNKQKTSFKNFISRERH